MSFADLHLRAKGRQWREEEVEAFRLMSQAEKNKWVLAMAAEADGVKTEQRIGTDGVTYIAFWVDDLA
jgi:hypothetical protein